MGIEPLATRVVELVALALLSAQVSSAQLLGDDELARARTAHGQLQEHLTGRAREALEDLQQHPESEDNRADLRKQLGRFLLARPSLAYELDHIVPKSLDIEPADAVMNRVGSALNRAAREVGSFHKARIE
ncbi:hypothetical protein CCS01_10370 [Rhodopila globiformis]|uniref:Uncharacterized protein n=1 Tax=Rhodopila globiformis TaxID=1071 RepID=A0A2S6NIQ8_RHOGL|nr:hypothetical protein CCS01_10370 [Rhodopila globiformis]